MNNTARKRPEYSQIELLQAQDMGNITEEHRSKRQVSKTHPIDNVESYIVTDRDDGIFVELKQEAQGGYLVHITIADVAAHVDLRSSIAKKAILRAFTVYGAGFTDPMFMKMLEEKMSLEHQQDRLGFTVSISLDKNFKPKHTEFKPVITNAEAMSYAQVAEQMQTNKQLQEMSAIAEGVRNYYFGGQDSSFLLEDGFSGRDLSVSSSSSWQSATKMVATYMLLANSCMAEFFNKSGLPYIYRNFAGNSENARAFYEVENKGHDALRKDIGLNGAYGHFTSPIRRAPDFLNANMAHFAFNTLDNLEKNLEKFQSPELHIKIWQSAPEILKICGSNDIKLKLEVSKRIC